MTLNFKSENNNPYVQDTNLQTLNRKSRTVIGISEFMEYCRNQLGAVTEVTEDVLSDKHKIMSVLNASESLCVDYMKEIPSQKYVFNHEETLCKSLDDGNDRKNGNNNLFTETSGCPNISASVQYDDSCCSLAMQSEDYLSLHVANELKQQISTQESLLHSLKTILSYDMLHYEGLQSFSCSLTNTDFTQEIPRYSTYLLFCLILRRENRMEVNIVSAIGINLTELNLTEVLSMSKIKLREETINSAATGLKEVVVSDPTWKPPQLDLLFSSAFDIDGLKLDALLEVLKIKPQYLPSQLKFETLNMTLDSSALCLLSIHSFDVQFHNLLSWKANNVFVVNMSCGVPSEAIVSYTDLVQIQAFCVTEHSWELTHRKGRDPVPIVSGKKETDKVQMVTDTKGTGQVQMITDTKGTCQVQMVTDTKGTGQVQMVTDTKGTGQVQMITDSKGTGQVQMVTDTKGTCQIHMVNDEKGTGQIHMVNDKKEKDQNQIVAGKTKTDLVHMVTYKKETDPLEMLRDRKGKYQNQMVMDKKETDPVDSVIIIKKNYLTGKRTARKRMPKKLPKPSLILWEFQSDISRIMTQLSKETDLRLYWRTILMEYCQRTLEQQIAKDVSQRLYIAHPEQLHQTVAVYPIRSFRNRVNTGEPITREQEMQFEWLRFITFHNYEGGGNGIALARNGFYHDHDQGPNATRCFACDVVCEEWTLSDNVEQTHRRLSPNCPLLHNNSGEGTHRNISIAADDGPQRATSTANVNVQDASATGVSHSPTATSTARPPPPSSISQPTLSGSIFPHGRGPANFNHPATPETIPQFEAAAAAGSNASPAFTSQFSVPPLTRRLENGQLNVSEEGTNPIVAQPLHDPENREYEGFGPTDLDSLDISIDGQLFPPDHPPDDILIPVISLAAQRVGRVTVGNTVPLVGRTLPLDGRNVPLDALPPPDLPRM
ncbi:uncharacterized protein LOC127854816 isoform X1 [Dreissena polymorpha]|uniref:uncharacterized protein LOC127854816 isoform X1 n=1 Tax=Dreissena polymorpha TaxID=45954 RepID=UPI002263B726|nr:uncharacterized protein LOC127854816 isoform X1 [Dreissena polymorpha]